MLLFMLFVVYQQALLAMRSSAEWSPCPLLLQLLSPMQQARLAAVAWPWYPYPSKWAPLLLEAQAS